MGSVRHGPGSEREGAPVRDIERVRQLSDKAPSAKAKALMKKIKVEDKGYKQTRHPNLKIRDRAGRHTHTRVHEFDGYKTYKAAKGGVDEHA
jgi:hypothetical protein